MESQECLPHRSSEAASPKTSIRLFIYEPDVCRRVRLIRRSVGKLESIVIICEGPSKLRSKLLMYPKCLCYKDRVQSRSCVVFEDCSTYSKIKVAEEYARAGFQTLAFTSHPALFLEYSRRAARALRCMHTQMAFYKSMFEQSKLVFYRCRSRECRGSLSTRCFAQAREADVHSTAGTSSHEAEVCGCTHADHNEEVGEDSASDSDHSGTADAAHKLRKLDKLIALLGGSTVVLVSGQQKTSRMLARLYGGKHVEAAPGLIRAERMVFVTFAYLRDNKLETLWTAGTPEDKLAYFVYFDFDFYCLGKNRFLLLSEKDKERLLEWVLLEEEIVLRRSDCTVNVQKSTERETAMSYALWTESPGRNAASDAASKAHGSSMAQKMNAVRRHTGKGEGRNEEALIEVDGEVPSSLLSSHWVVPPKRPIGAGKRQRLLIRDKDALARVEMVHSAVQAPVRILSLTASASTGALQISMLRLGHVSSLSTFSDAVLLADTGTFCLRNRDIHIIYVADRQTYKLTLSLLDLDPFVFVHTVPEEEWTYLTVTTRNFFRVLRLGGDGECWQRMSIRDMPECRDRFDVQFRTKFKVASVLGEHFASFVLVYSRLAECSTGLTLQEVRRMCEHLPFEEYYHLECFLSQKGRFVANRMTADDLGRVIRAGLISAIKRLDRAVDRRFVDMGSAIESALGTAERREGQKAEDIAAHGMSSHSTSDSVALVKSAVYTPFRAFYLYPSCTGSNRVLREFDEDKFIRVGFRDENMVDRIARAGSQDNTEVFEHYRLLLRDGVYVGKRKFFFLAMSSSQMRLHNAWFVTPYTVRGTLVGPDFIRSWMGDFSMIRNIGKYAVRLGQVLSTTTRTFPVARYREAEDIARNGYTFSDGAGMVNRATAERISSCLRLATTPSVFQIRFAGYKGTVAVCDMQDDLVLRASMRKFDSRHSVLEIVTYSQRRPFYMNRQLIMILESLGVPQSVFVRMHDHHVLRALRKSGFVNRNFLHAGGSRTCAEESTSHGAAAASGGGCALACDAETLFHSEEPQRLFSCAGCMFSEMKGRSRIFVSRGRTLMGIVDEMGVLEKEEVFVMSRISEEDDVLDGTVNVRGEYLVVNAPAVVAKNPCLHPGDLRIVRAVDVPELYHLKECVVFSQKGERPVFNMCSGSDLDGDMYAISWDSRLVPPTTADPDTYADVSALHKEVVLMSDVANFFVRYMQDDQIGLISNAHLAFSDMSEDGVRSKEALRLATLFNMGIDFPKTGYVATLPYDLVPKCTPDYMETSGGRRYLSTKAIGKLYRRSSYLVFPDEAFCNCTQCLSSGEKVSYPNAVERYMDEGREMAERYECGEIKSLRKYKKELACNEMRALAWHKAGAEKRGHSLFPFLVEEFVDVSKYVCSGEESGVLKKMLHMFDTPHEHFVLNKSIICVDHAHSRKLDDIRAYARKNIKTQKTCAFQDSLPYLSIAGASVVLAGAQRLEHIRGAITPSISRVLSELFMILLSMKFLSVEDFDNALSFVEFIIESMASSLTKEHLIEVLVKIASDFYSADRFNLSVPFTEFLLFGIGAACHLQPCAGSLAHGPCAPSTQDGDRQAVPNRMHRELILEHRSNSLLAAALLLSTPLSLRYKLRISQVISKCHAFDVCSKSAVHEKSTHLCKQNEVVVMGMFDHNDEVYLTPCKHVLLARRKEPHALVPDLLNFGSSSVLIYKDYLRKFVIGHLQHSTSSVYTRISLGVFYLYDVPLRYRNNNISIKDLKSLVSFESTGPLKARFHKGVFFSAEHSGCQLAGLGLRTKSRERCYVLRLRNGGAQYAVYADHAGVVEKVVTGCKTLGYCLFVRPNTATRCDLNVEVVQESVLLPSSLPTELAFLSAGSVLSMQQERCVLNPQCSEFRDVELTMHTYLTVSDGCDAEIRVGQVRKFFGVECTEYDSYNFMESLSLQNRCAPTKHRSAEAAFESVWKSLCLLNDVISAESKTWLEGEKP